MIASFAAVTYPEKKTVFTPRALEEINEKNRSRIEKQITTGIDIENCKESKKY